MATAYDLFRGAEPHSSALLRARATNASRDAIDLDSGFGPPGSACHAEHLRCAMAAIGAGLLTRSPECVYEGIAMLQDIELSLRGGK